jgi:hypothetical protein
MALVVEVRTVLEQLDEQPDGDANAVEDEAGRGDRDEFVVREGARCCAVVRKALDRKVVLEVSFACNRDATEGGKSALGEGLWKGIQVWERLYEYQTVYVRRIRALMGEERKCGTDAPGRSRVTAS